MKIIRKKLMVIIVIGIVLSALISGTTALISFTAVGEERSKDILNREIEMTASNLDDICLNAEKTVDSLSEYYLKVFPGLDELRGEVGKDYIDNAKVLAKTMASHNEYICAIYYRFNPEILDSKSGFFISKIGDSTKLAEQEPTDISKYDRDDAEHVAWFYEPLDAGKALWVDQYMNLNNDILTLTYAKPLFTTEGDFIGVVGVDINAKFVYDQIARTRIYDTGFAAMLSPKGELKYSPKDIYLNDEAVSQILQSKRIEDLTYYEQQKKMTVLSKQLRYGDYLLIIIANDDLYSLEQRVTFTIVLITLIVSLCIISVMTGLLYKLFSQFKTDTMTRTENRSSYMEEVADIDAELRDGREIRYTLVVFDINGLKQTNDELGHAAGDELLKKAGRLISEHFTQGTIYRVGGDEFVFLSRKNNQTSVRYIFEKFQKAMNDSAPNFDVKSGTVVISAGMATYEAGVDACYEDTFNRADQEMYLNKKYFYEVNKQLDRRK